MKNKNLDIDFVLDDIYKKIGIRNFELNILENKEIVLNNKYLIKLDSEESESTDLIYHDKEFNYCIYKYHKDNKKD